MKSSKWTGWYTVLCLLGVFYPVTGLTSASQAKITHLVIKNTEDSLVIDLKIDSDFTPEMKTALLNGVPVRFTYSITLYEVRDYWFDRKAASRTIIHELRYDAIRKVYKITQPQGTMKPTYIEDFDSARLHISEINNLAVIALTALKKGEHYQLMVGTVLGIKKFTLFNFYSEFKTDHYTVNFTY